MHVRAASASLLLALAAATASMPARAQDAQTQAMGRALFNEGVALYNAGNYGEACPKLEASLRAYPGIGTRGKLAECYEKLGRHASAWAMYREVAQLATRSGDAAREQIASERARSLEPKLSYLTVSIPPANDVPGLIVKRDGRDIDRSKLGAAEPADPGTVSFEVSAPDKKTVTAQVVLTPGQRARFDVPSLEPAVAPAPHPEPVAEPVTPRSEERLEWQKPTGLVLGGVGIAGLAVGTIFGLSAQSTYNGAFDDGRCDRATKQCDASGQQAVEDARSLATVSTVLVAAGAAFAVGGAVLYFTAPSSSSRRALRIAPTTWAGGGGLVGSGSF